MKHRNHTRRFYGFDRLMAYTPLPIWRDRPMAELQRLASHVWCAERQRGPCPRVVAGRGVLVGSGGLVSYQSGPLIVLARHQRNLGTLLHELAHAMTRGGYEHGPAFTRRALYLYEQYGGIPPDYMILLRKAAGL